MQPNPEIASTSRMALKRVLTGLATLAVLGVIYGSWLPFEFDTQLLEQGAPALLDQVTWAPANLADALTNILIYVPIGLLLSLRMRLSGWNRFIVAGCIGLIAVITIGASELGQTAIPNRTASFVDMIFNGLGMALGLALAPLVRTACARLSTRLKLALALSPRRALFVIVASLVVFAKLAPFDFAIFPADLADSIAAARWSPFDAQINTSPNFLEDVAETAGSFFAFVLLGIIGTLALLEAGEGRFVSIVDTIGKLIILAVAVELLQLVIVSRTCDIADVLSYVYGGLVGSIVATTLSGGRMRSSGSASNAVAARFLLVAALVVQSVIIIGYAFPADAQTMSSAASSIQWIPFNGHFQQHATLSLARVVSSFMWYFTLAVISASVMAGRSWHYRLVAVLTITVGLVALTEAAQVIGRVHHADVTEILLALVAALAATFSCRWIEHARHARSAEATIEIW